MFKTLNNFQQRFLLGFLGILVVAGIIFFSHTPPFQYLFIASVALVQALALWEFYTLAKAKNIAPFTAFGISFSLLYVALHEIVSTESFLLFFMASLFAYHFKQAHGAIANIATTLFGFLYITIPLTFLIDLNYPKGIFEASAIWIVYLIAVTKMTDTTAYIAGKTLGRHRFVPTLSPKKTWEGAVGGLIGASVTSLLFCAIAERMHFPIVLTVWQQFALGSVLGIFAQIGDLAESLLKRDANVKDSNSLPGFGGFLDIVDSLIFTAPFLYFWLRSKNMV